MEETEAPRQIKSTLNRRGIKLTDVIITVVILLVVAFLVNALLRQLALKREVSSARAATESFLTDVRQHDAASAYKFGDAAFRSKYTEKELANLFPELDSLVKNSPTVIKQTATNGKENQVVAIYYKFSKPDYYFAVTVIRPNGTDKWQLLSFSGSPTQADLYKTQ